MRKWFVLLLITVLPITSLADSVKIGDLWYNLYNEANPVATVVSSQGEGYTGEIVIPSSIEYDGVAYTVDSIGKSAFASSTITGTTVPSFDLKKVTLPSSIKVVGDYAFYYSNEIEKIEIPEGCVSIGSGAFMWCGALESLYLPSTLSNIGDNAFQYCRKLTRVHSYILNPFEINVNVFGREYGNVTGLEYGENAAQLYVPDGTKAKYEMLDGWKLFKEIIEGEYHEVEKNGLCYSYLKGKGFATLISGDYSGLTSLSIPELITIDGETYTVNEIGESAFHDVSSLKDVSLPSTIKNIGERAFAGCTGLSRIEVPSSVAMISDGAFQDCFNVYEIILNEGIKSIGSNAFRRLGSWQSNSIRLVLPSTLSSIGDAAFENINNLKIVTSYIDSPFVINPTVFRLYTSKWDVIELKDVITTYPSSATLYVPKGRKTAYEAIEGWCVFSKIIEGEYKELLIDGLIYAYEDSGTAMIVEGDYSELHYVRIPASIVIEGKTYNVNEIGAKAFYGCSIDTLIISEGIEIISSKAFYDNQQLKSLTLPNSLKSIENAAFMNCTNIESIVIPPNLTYIGQAAFLNLRRLAIMISKIQTPFAIDDIVFGICNSWGGDGIIETYGDCDPSSATLYVPKGTLSAYQAIKGWTLFTEIVDGELRNATIDGISYSYVEGHPDAKVVAGDYSQITDVIIPSTVVIEGAEYFVKVISRNAFRDYWNIKSVVIGEGVELIEDEAFSHCGGLESIILPEGITKIGDYALCYIGDGTSGNPINITLPSTLTSIGHSLFLNSNLGSIISKIITPFEIDDNTFIKGYSWNEETQSYQAIPCKANLYVPEGSLASYQAIKGWTMFAGIYEGDLQETIIDGLKYSFVPGGKTATIVSGDYFEMTKVIIPTTITVSGNDYVVNTIGSSAFKGCSNLDTLIIGNGIEIIGDYAFWGCGKIRNLDIPEGVLSIGEWAFTYCEGLQKVILPSSIISIGDYGFARCGSIVRLISRIQNPFSIKKNVFCSNWGWSEERGQYYDNSTATLCVPEGTITRYQALDGWMMFADYVEGELLEVTIDGLDYIINTGKKTASVTKAENYSGRCTIPSYVTVDNINYSVKSIAAKAFYNTSITEIVLGDVETIGQEAFRYCSQLGSVSFPTSLTSIASRAFANCTKITSLEISSELSSLGECVFSGCNGVNSVIVDDDNQMYESQGSNAIIEKETQKLIFGCKNTIIPNGVVEIGEEAFFDVDIKKISIPSTVKSIGNNAFNLCRSLEEVSLPEGVETVGANAFANCEAISTIELPNSMKNFGESIFYGCKGLQNVVSYIEDPEEIQESVFGNYDYVYGDPTLWVPRGKAVTYQQLGGWNRFKIIEEMLGDTLKAPNVSYNGRYLTLTIPKEQKSQIYYSTDGKAPSILYSDTVAISNIGTILAISKRFGSYTVDTTRYEIAYVYDGVTARTASVGLLAKCFEWCGTDKVEMLDIKGTINDDDFGTIRSLENLRTLKMSTTTIADNTLPNEAFANTKIQWYVSPYTLNGVGANIFKGCQQLAAITWNSSRIKLPKDVATDVSNPNMLVYAENQAMIPYAIKNVVVEGVANNVVLADSLGNNNFYCPESFVARRISYTHDFKQKTIVGKTQGWETIALPFTVSSITHETNGELTPYAVEGAEKPFWLYELGDNGLEAAAKIEANIPYLICMPNDDAYGDEYMQGGLVTFSAKNVTITSSTGTAVSQGDRQFVPTYKRVAASSDIYVLNVNEAVGDNPMGSAFIQNLREVRPFEAYSVHGTNRSRIISVSSLGGGNATGINDLMLKNGVESDDAVVKVYSLSGTLIKHGKREEVLRSLPKGLYIINGKKIIK